jgi:hypothetical protein
VVKLILSSTTQDGQDGTPSDLLAPESGTRGRCPAHLQETAPVFDPADIPGGCKKLVSPQAPLTVGASKNRPLVMDNHSSLHFSKI